MPPEHRNIAGAPAVVLLPSLRPRAMRCSEFLLGYSDFRDETIDDPLVRRRFIAHVSLCGRCARYQEVIDLGVSLLRSADQIEVSPRFHTRLARRLAAAVLHPEPVFAVPATLHGRS